MALPTWPLQLREIWEPWPFRCFHVDVFLSKSEASTLKPKTAAAKNHPPRSGTDLVDQPGRSAQRDLGLCGDGGYHLGSSAERCGDAASGEVFAVEVKGRK